MSDAATTKTEAHHLATFRSRGVSVPFTSPLLAGARLRRAKPSGIELLMPSPSGGRGIYVLNWAGVRALCHPTIHDTLLFRDFLMLPAIDPPNIRAAALDVARRGVGGRDVAAAAEASLARDAAQRTLAKFLLSVALLEQTEPNGPKAMSSADVDRRTSAMLLRVAPSLGCPAAQLATDLVDIAGVLAPLGIAPNDTDARLCRVLIRLRDAQVDLSRWLNADPDNDISGLGNAIAAAMKRMYQNGRTVLTKTRSAATDPMMLLRHWITDRASVAATTARCGWLLDGWERLSLLWLCAETRPSRRAALLEMAPIVPVLPREVMEWTDMPIGAEALEQSWHVTSREDTWRTGGAAFALIERNEKLLAMSA